MGTDRASVILRLDLIAAKARQLSSDVQNNKLWPGQLASGLGEINEQMQHLRMASKEDR